MPEAKTERKKLTVTQVQEPKPVGDKGAVKLPFKAKDTEGKELAYFTFTKSIFEFIKLEAVIKADVEVSIREYEGNTYTDRKVTMIYQDGKPIAGERKQWQGGRDSPEQRASIESQVAAKIVAELWIAGKVFPADPILGALYHWLCEKLGIKDETQGKPSPAPAKPSESQPGKPISDMAENARAEEGLSPKPTTKPFDLKKFMQEFTETRTILENAGQEKWKYDVLLARLNEMTGVSARTVPAAISKLTEEQREAIASELKKDFQEAR